MAIVTLLVAVGWAAVHLLAGRLRVLDVVPRSRWLSAAGGASVAYIFVHVLPELSEGQETLEEAAADVGSFVEHHVYLMALAGLAVFYGIERRIRSSGSEQRADRGDFWLHLGSFTIYNALVGALLWEREAEPGAMLPYFLAMTLHFVTVDFGLWKDYGREYERVGRFFLASGVIAGWLVGWLWELPQLVAAAVFAFLAGGIILNVLKEELPEERESRFGAFALGVIGYTLLLLLSS